MHKAQKEFCIKVKQEFPEHFIEKEVLDCGSMDINGNNRYLFDNCNYTGIDIGEGKNVDYVCPIHIWGGLYDTIISTECFEHDKYYKESLQNIVRMLRPGGMFLFTCATTGRAEHGTTRMRPSSSPYTNDYYKNLTKSDIVQAIDMDVFKVYRFEATNNDLYFWGIKE